MSAECSTVRFAQHSAQQLSNRAAVNTAVCAAVCSAFCATNGCSNNAAVHKTYDLALFPTISSAIVSAIAEAHNTDLAAQRTAIRSTSVQSYGTAIVSTVIVSNHATQQAAVCLAYRATQYAAVLSTLIWANDTTDGQTQWTAFDATERTAFHTAL